MADYSLQDLEAGIKAADAAGDTEAVKKLGAEYMKMQGEDKYSSEEYDPLTKAVSGALKVRKMAREARGAITEPIMSLASSMIAKPVSEIAGLTAAGYEMSRGGEGAQNIPGFQKEVQEKLTYEPKTMAGRSRYNPLNVIPMAIGKGIGAITPEKAAPGEATTPAGALRNIASEAIPQAIGFIGMKGAPKAAAPVQKVAKTLRKSAEGLMQSALKPTVKDLMTGKAAKAIDTMLEKGIPATEKGIEQTRARIDDLNNQIKDVIATSPQRVETRKLMRPVVEKLRDFKRQVNPNADVAAIKKSWDEFKNHPLLQEGGMSVQTAQALKQGTYRQLAKKYGQLGSADVEAQKAIARGLKEQVAEKVPEVVPLNLEESKLLNVLSVAERRIVMEANKNPMGLSLLAKNPKAWAAFLADRSASAKSLLARIMNRASKKLTGETTEAATKAGSVIAPTQVDKEKQKQYEMNQYRGAE